MNIKQKIGRGLAGLVLASGITGAAVSGSGCTTAADAYGQALFENVIIPTAASAVVDEGIRTSIAGPRGTTVNVNNQGSQAQTQQLPENVVLNSRGLWEPVEGYYWINQKEFKVKKRPKEGYYWINPTDPNDFRAEKILENRIPEPGIEHFICMNWDYSNLDEKNPLDGIKGIKNNFFVGEEFCVGCLVKAYPGDEITIKVRDPNDKLVIDKMWQIRGLYMPIENRILAQSEGEYKVEYYVDNKLIAIEKVRISN